MYDAFIFTHSLVVFGPSQSSLKLESVPFRHHHRYEPRTYCPHIVLIIMEEAQLEQSHCRRNHDKICTGLVKQSVNATVKTKTGRVAGLDFSSCHLVIIWSVSMTLWEIMRRNHKPFKSRGLQAVYHSLVDGHT